MDGVKLLRRRFLVGSLVETLYMFMSWHFSNCTYILEQTAQLQLANNNQMLDFFIGNYSFWNIYHIWWIPIKNLTMSKIFVFPHLIDFLKSVLSLAFVIIFFLNFSKMFFNSKIFVVKTKLKRKICNYIYVYLSWAKIWMNRDQHIVYILITFFEKLRCDRKSLSAQKFIWISQSPTKFFTSDMLRLHRWQEMYVLVLCSSERKHSDTGCNQIYFSKIQTCGKRAYYNLRKHHNTNYWRRSR